MIGKKVAEPFVTIIDDGTNMNLAGSLNVDDEGTPGQKTVLVENGILVYIFWRRSTKEMDYGGAGQCGKNGQGVPVSFGLPTCLVKSLTVGGTRQKGGQS